MLKTTKYKITNLTNIKINKNKFEKKKTYSLVNKPVDIGLMCYFTYIPELDKLIYSYREKLPKNHPWPTDYSKENTSICDMVDDKLINHKTLFKLNNISHNYTIHKIKNNYIGLGGVFGISRDHNCKNQYGIFYNLIDDINNCLFPKTFDVTSFNPLIKYDLSFKQNFIKHYDSSISIIYFKKKYLLYARHNEKSGKRNTQIFISNNIEKNYKKYNIVKFDKKVHTYSQFLYVENNIIFGIFRIYDDIMTGSHRLYNKNPRVILAYSHDAINFKIIYNINSEFYDYPVNNYKKENNYNYFFTGNSENHTLTKYKIRCGGYINFEQNDKKKESTIELNILNEISNITMNYTIVNDGYIKLYFYNLNNELQEEKNLNGDYIDFKIDVKKKFKYIKITFSNSLIYQIL